MRFLSIGECMAELAPSGDAEAYQMGFAGDTLNTAWYLARCAPAIAVRYYSAVGNDAISAKMTEFIAASGIDTRHIRTDPHRTIGLYLVSLDQGERSFSYWRGQSAAKGLADDRERLERATEAADMIYFSGITLAILPPERRPTLLEALRKARAAGRSIAFDPNLRPGLWATPDEMTETTMLGAAVSDIVLPSFEDEAGWFADADPQATARRYQGAGAETVVVKNGAAAVYFTDGASHGEVPVTPAETVVDTTAAGDSFNAGVLARRAAGDSLPKAIAYACALSRAVVQERGALVSVTLPDA